MRKIKIVSPWKNAKETWLGLDTPGLRRKVFRLVDKELVNSEHLVAGLTIFEPGEASSWHNHPGSEEVNIVFRGHGELVDDGQRVPFSQNDWMFIPKGVYHQHINTGDEPLWLIWIYTPPGEIPKT